ncbi:hypothetical protein HOP52_08890 [Halomonas campisalis]|uniref:DUF7281 domain-containing protein n=1 Tax=Billgrantia campisalis TaxID=74661 RepID=A0ABS9P9S8_9GAMM|nr:hypothetical protein [Halomonas campisalis]MCG6657870.1 hypothetical protein [Halomonas campisalis]MDR5863606.1 hypothetical protein [Halomonas campisalis]
MSLSPGAYKLLRGIRERLRRAPGVEKPRSGKVVAEIEAWCAEHDIELGVRRSTKALRFDRELLTQIDDTLAALGQPAIDVDLSGLTSGEQAGRGSLEAKSVRESPRARRVLVSLAAGAPRPGLVAETREYRDLDRRSLDLGAFDALIQVENLDGFYAFDPDSVAGARWRNPLVVYRGDTHYGGGFAALAEAWAATAKPHCYLGDFDASGVGFALASRATHLLLPPREWLEQHATPDHLPAAQMTAQAGLRDHRDTLPDGHPLREHLALILDEQRGLRQQWFAERLVRVSLGRDVVGA